MSGDSAQTRNGSAGKTNPSTFALPAESRKNNFDFLRFFLATLVIYHHSFDLLLGHRNAQWRFESTHTDTIGLLTGGQLNGGELAVDYFFVISGFLIAASWMHSKGVFDYLKKRFLRIYPGLFAALLFCIIIVGPLSRQSIGTYFHDKATYQFLRPLFLRSATDSLPGVFATVPFTGAVNGSLWTIRYEIFCYLIIAALGLATLLRRREIVAGLFVVSLAVYVARARGISIPHLEEASYMPRLLTYYLAGTVFYLYRDRIPCSKRLFWLVCAGIIVSFLLNVSLITFPVLGTYFLFYVAFNRSLRLENFARYGDFSYGTYLYAFPLQQLLIQYAGKSLNPYTLFLLSWPITVLLAATSWYLIEKPFLRLKSRAGTSRPTESPAEAVITVPARADVAAAVASSPEKRDTPPLAPPS